MAKHENVYWPSNEETNIVPVQDVVIRNVPPLL